VWFFKISDRWFEPQLSLKQSRLHEAVGPSQRKQALDFAPYADPRGVIGIQRRWPLCRVWDRFLLLAGSADGFGSPLQSERHDSCPSLAAVWHQSSGNEPPQRPLGRGHHK
jgi:hypothetical protein